MSSNEDDFVDANESFSDDQYPSDEQEESNSNEKVENSSTLIERKLAEEKLTVDELEKLKIDSINLKDTGNELFNSSNYKEAIEKYNQALDICPLICNYERSVMFSNRAACYTKLNELDLAIKDCDSSLELEPNYIKCLQRRARLLEDKERFSDALEDYKKLLQINPEDNHARCACATLPEKIRIQQEKMKEEMFGMLKQLGNCVLKPFGLTTDNFKFEKNPESEGYSVKMAR